jgi:hypothetical protein
MHLFSLQKLHCHPISWKYILFKGEWVLYGLQGSMHKANIKVKKEGPIHPCERVLLGGCHIFMIQTGSGFHETIYKRVQFSLFFPP